MPDQARIADAKAALSHLDLTDNPAAVRAASRDFFWYSPVLKARLDHVTGDFMVSPRSEAEVIEILKTCYAYEIPVTTRGAGTGNYGQAMPLAGGCVMNMRHMNRVLRVEPGVVVAEPGTIIRDLDEETRKTGQELRMTPSTAGTASIGGFIAGGSGGVGSVRWGVLRDAGNILRLRVATMEADPRILEFTGDDLARVSHAYGTNGVITRVEMPLAPSYDWINVFVSFADFARAAAYGADLASEDGILIKLACICEAPIAQRYFRRFQGHVGPEDNLVALMVAPHAMGAFLTHLARWSDARLVFRGDDHDWPRDPGVAYEYGWNHTTLRALKVDPHITYLQVRYAGPDLLDKIEAIRARFPGELMQHLEAMREHGRISYGGLTLVRFSTEERLDEIVRIHEQLGCMVFNPHRYTLEEGGRQVVDDRQLQFKREADPKGLLNPGKMIAWDVPDWDFSRMYDYAGMRRP